MKENLENSKISTEQEEEIPELTVEEWKKDKFFNYELTEAVLQYHMRKQ